MRPNVVARAMGVAVVLAGVIGAAIVVTRVSERHPAVDNPPDDPASLVSASGIPAFPPSFEGIITGTHLFTESFGIETYDFVIWHDGAEELVAIRENGRETGRELTQVFASGTYTHAHSMPTGGNDVVAEGGWEFDRARTRILGPIAYALNGQGDDLPVLVEEPYVGGTRILIDMPFMDEDEVQHVLWLDAQSKLPLSRDISGGEVAEAIPISEAWQFMGARAQPVAPGDLPDTDIDTQSDMLSRSFTTRDFAELSSFDEFPVYTAGLTVGDYEFYQAGFERTAGVHTESLNDTLGIDSDWDAYFNVFYVRDEANFRDQIHIDTRPLGHEMQPLYANSDEFADVVVAGYPGKMIEGPGGVTVAIQMPDGEVMISADTLELVELAAGHLQRENP